MKKTKPTFELWEVILIALITSIIMSSTTGYALYNNHRVNNCAAVTNNDQLGNFINSYNQIVTEYYKEVDQEGLINAAISGMINFLDDPYTTYLNENSKDALLESLKGKYEGIGVEIYKNESNLIEIVTVFDNTPASDAGLLKGDIISNINDIDVSEKSAEEAVDIIKNDKNKEVKITVNRNNELLTFNVVKKSLYIPVIVTNIFENNNQKIGYIKISKFSDTVGEQFSLKLKSLEAEGINSLIIDVRNNTGGYLKGSKDIASVFLKEDTTIYSLQSNLETTHYKDETDEHRNYKVVVLTNKNAASASEVLAGALKHSYGATLIGTTTYGKGTVQQTSNITNNSMIKYTTAKWLMPNGQNIDGIGIAPDITVELNLAEGEILTNENDLQLQTAITELSK